MWCNKFFFCFFFVICLVISQSYSDVQQLQPSVLCMKSWLITDVVGFIDDDCESSSSDLCDAVADGGRRKDHERLLGNQVGSAAAFWVRSAGVTTSSR